MSKMRNYRGPLDDKRGLSLMTIKEEVEEMGYASIDAVPTKTSQIENDSGYITREQAPVLSVNNKTGDVVLNLFSGNYSDLVGKPTLFNGDYSTLTNKPTLFKATDQAVQRVKYYSVVTNSSGVWTLDLTNEGFTKVLDVQVQAVSTTALLSGLRVASANAFTETSKVITGLAGAISLAGIISLSASTTVRLRVEGT